MANEYSYFKAEGQSLAVARTVSAANEACDALKRSLSAKFNAEVYVTNRRLPTFVFQSRRPLPADWIIRETDSDSPPRYHIAEPAAGSADEAFILDVVKKFRIHQQQGTLETVFGCGEMPMGSIAAGRYSRSFVMQERLESPDYMSYKSTNNKRQGMLSDHVTICFGSNSPIIFSDPLDYMKLGDDFYLRVPNDANGVPHFSPPDAVSVDFDEMLKLDYAEYQKQRAAYLVPKPTHPAP